MMTKKHFIKLADNLRNEMEYGTLRNLSEDQKESVILFLCRFCGQQNSRFNADTFKGYMKGTCGPSGGKVRR